MSDDSNGQKNGFSARIEPVRISPKTRFKFLCHKGVKCFTRCCHGISITLTPYDIILLKKRLGLLSREFLAIYTEPKLLEKTDMPMVQLKLVEKEGQKEPACPFVREEGCIVYTDRPTACRYYPLGVATLSHDAVEEDEEGFYFFVNEPHCLGFEEEKEWNVEEWRKDQGVDIHDEINRLWTEILVRKRSFPANIHITEEAKRMFFLAAYDMDRFRDFVFGSSFLNRVEVPGETIEKIKADDIELLKFGLAYINFLLFKQGDFKLKEGADKARKKPGEKD